MHRNWAMKIKNFLNSLLALIMFTSVISLNPVNLYTKAHDETIYDGKLSLIENNEFFDVYVIEEQEIKSEVIIDKINNICIFNGLQYSLDEYKNAIKEQNTDLNNGIFKSLHYYLSNGENPQINYKNIIVDEQLESEFKKGDICLYANCNPNEVPTTGYGTLKYVGIQYENNLLISLTSGALSLIASLLFGGIVGSAKWFAGAVINALLSAGFVGTIIGDVQKATYQALHQSCPATKQEQRFTVTSTDENGDLYTHKEKTVSYFYHSKPW